MDDGGRDGGGAANRGRGGRGGRGRGPGRGQGEGARPQRDPIDDSGESSDEENQNRQAGNGEQNGNNPFRQDGVESDDDDEVLPQPQETHVNIAGLDDPEDVINHVS